MTNKSRESQRKGKALEQAVSLIQDAILSADPNLAGAKFSIETNKHITVDGVRHEIDVYVKTLPDSPYESIHIFECKNRKRPVDKNAAIVLSEKVNAVGASKGYLVAPKFTKDATAQIAKDKRLKNVTCRDEFVSPIEVKLWHVTHDPYSIIVQFKERGKPPLHDPIKLDHKRSEFCLSGQRVELSVYAMQHVNEMARADQVENRARYLETSSHHQMLDRSFESEPGVCVVDDHDMESMMISVNFWVHVGKKKLISKFELEAQGRTFSFEPVEIKELEKQIEITVVQLG